MRSRIVSFLRSTFWRARFEQEMDAELRGHVRAYVEDLIDHGAPSGEAYAQARREFGALEAVLR